MRPDVALMDKEQRLAKGCRREILALLRAEISIGDNDIEHCRRGAAKIATRWRCHHAASFMLERGAITTRRGGVLRVA